jgi:hypothetical protein
MALKVWRPMRPKPLMPILVAKGFSFQPFSYYQLNRMSAVAIANDVAATHKLRAES